MGVAEGCGCSQLQPAIARLTVVKKPFRNWRREKSLGKGFCVMGLILAYFRDLGNWDSSRKAAERCRAAWQRALLDPTSSARMWPCRGSARGAYPTLFRFCFGRQVGGWQVRVRWSRRIGTMWANDGVATCPPPICPTWVVGNTVKSCYNLVVNRIGRIDNLIYKREVM